jgi:predicted MFS family arabinose efflux permease
MIMEAISGRLQKEQAMLSYLAVFAVGTLIGSLAMGLWVALANYQDFRDD